MTTSLEKVTVLRVLLDSMLSCGDVVAAGHCARNCRKPLGVVTCTKNKVFSRGWNGFADADGDREIPL